MNYNRPIVQLLRAVSLRQHGFLVDHWRQQPCPIRLSYCTVASRTCCVGTEKAGTKRTWREHDARLAEVWEGVRKQERIIADCGRRKPASSAIHQRAAVRRSLSSFDVFSLIRRHKDDTTIRRASLLRRQYDDVDGDDVDQSRCDTIKRLRTSVAVADRSPY